MKTIFASTITLAVLTTLMLPTRSWAIKPMGRAVAIYVDDMHCKNCAKKIARKLYAVPGVVAVHADVKKNVALVTPQKGKDPSLRALWEAVEAAKFKPVKLVVPGGAFESKPSS